MPEDSLTAPLTDAPVSLVNPSAWRESVRFCSNLRPK